MEGSRTYILQKGQPAQNQVRIIWILTSIARRLFKTLESMATPFSVKVRGRLRNPIL
jgi:hypothetical protein